MFAVLLVPTVASGLFLTEVPLRGDALRWAKEMSRLRRGMAAVVALYTNEESSSEVCYVGWFDDAPFAVAALAKKHGTDVIAKVRHEEFPAEALEDDMGYTLMKGLADDWLQQAEADLGRLPRGNLLEDWDVYDTSANPFAIGLLGDTASAAAKSSTTTDDGFGGRSSSTVAAASLPERYQQRRELLKAKMDEAIANKQEDRAMVFLRRIARLDDGDDDFEDDDDDVMPLV